VAPGRPPFQRTNVLLFKKKFLSAIVAGEKTQTIRLWKFRKMRPGQRSYIPGVGYIGILAVDEIAIDELVDADAIPDGFPTAAALRAEIQSLYGSQLAAGSRAFRVKFRVLDPEEQAAAATERKARKAAPQK
jgi:hypothetical protein